MITTSNPIRLYYDAEFTSLSRQGRLISLSFVSTDDHIFYAEFNDYPRERLSPWVTDHVLPFLMYPDEKIYHEDQGESVYIKNNSATIRDEFNRWIAPMGPLEIYGDCPSYDWVLFCDLFGSAMDIPNSIYYIPFDLATILRCRSLDPDMDRERFVADHRGESTLNALTRRAKGKHNALYDALILKTMLEILEHRQ